ncbi:MAG: 30S ribosome-binding factor RbfA [Gemmatimonadota bacterium]|nr:30S ribosome-binding factor RbfA [Gemmatimonadota bacterium]
MATRRVERVSDLIKQQVSNIIRNDLKDPRVGFITVTSVDLSRDLRHAKVFISVMGSDEDRSKSLEGLERASGFIRSRLGNMIRIRHIPELLFRHDDSYEYAARIAVVMKQIDLETKKEDEITNSDSDQASVEDADHG